MENKLYGELKSEKTALENDIARKIVREINTFGVNDRQKWLIMFFLGMELEKVTEMQSVTSFVRSQRQDLFVADMADDGEKTHDS